MIVILCTNAACQARFRVLGDPAEVATLVGDQSEFWPDRYVCPLCEGRAQCVSEAEIDVSTLGPVRDLEAMEMFQALNGVGLPEEMNCTQKNVAELLLHHRVVRIGGHDVRNTPRYALEWMDLDSGHRLFFAASSHGALVYRIRPPVNHTKKLLEGSDEQA